MNNSPENILIKELFPSDEVFSLFAELYSSAFPWDERMPLKMIISHMESGRMRTFMVYDHERFIGFYNVIFHGKLAYLAYFAVDHPFRHQGYGTIIINKIRKQLENYTICFDIEYADENADNYEERVSRYEFYEHNGFHDTGNLIYLYGVDYEILSSDPHLTAEEYLSIFQSMNIRGFNYEIKRRGQ